MIGPPRVARSGYQSIGREPALEPDREPVGLVGEELLLLVVRHRLAETHQHLESVVPAAVGLPGVFGAAAARAAGDVTADRVQLHPRIVGGLGARGLFDCGATPGASRGLQPAVSELGGRDDGDADQSGTRR